MLEGKNQKKCTVLENEFPGPEFGEPIDLELNEPEESSHRADTKEVGQEGEKEDCHKFVKAGSL